MRVITKEKKSYCKIFEALFLKCVFLVFCFFGDNTVLADSQKMMGNYQSEMIFYKNTQFPLVGTVAEGWQWPGTALTANTSRFSADLLSNAKLIEVRWVVVWNPKSKDLDFPSAIRLVNFDNGPKNIEPMSVVNSPSDRIFATPRVDVVNVTEQFRQLLEKGVTKQIGHQTMSSSGIPILVYGSWLEFVWSVAEVRR